MQKSGGMRRLRLEIEALEKLEANARVRADIAELSELWSDDLLISSTEKMVFSKAQFLRRMQGDQVRFLSFERTISRMTLNEDTAISIGREVFVPATGPDAGKSIVAGYMNVWAAMGGKWRWQLFGRKVDILVKQPPNSEWMI